MSLDVHREFDFAKNTTYGCGGIAKASYYPENSKEAQIIFDMIAEKGERYYILGNGSDVLAQDGFFEGNIIVTKKMRGMKLLANGNLYCESGVLVSTLMKFCEANGIGGLEYLSGIPATMGGICYMNGGIAGHYISDNVVNVTIYDGKIRVLSSKECKYTYKNSTMRDIKCLILGCELAFSAASRQSVREAIEYYKDRRKNLPFGKSCGCVFKNPESVSAGELIEAAGLKGYNMGGAMVSKKHANFLINRGSCSQDVYNLISYVKRIVFEKFSIVLEEEVCYIGDFK